MELFCGIGVGFVLGIVIVFVALSFIDKQKVSVNSLEVLQAMKFWLIRERYRHEQDIKAINKDLEKVNGVDLPPGLRLDAWYEIRR
jgi:hypothetical protein